MTRPIMLRQRKGESVKGTFQLFHKWAADVNVVVKDKNYKRPGLGRGRSLDPHPPKNPKFHLKAVKGKRRRILMQNDDTITGEYPSHDQDWSDVLGNESDDSDYFDEPWYFKIDTKAPRRSILEDYKPQAYPPAGEEDTEFKYISYVIQDGIKYGYPILPLMKRFLIEGAERRRPRLTYWDWGMKHKLMIFAHCLWVTLYVAPIFICLAFYPPANTVETKHGIVWPAGYSQKYDVNGMDQPFHFWPPHQKQKIGWTKATLIGYGFFFACNFVAIAVNAYFNPPWEKK
ncbi:hypothetical protein TWF730_007471 [Orbilia blumenaviensis]|uniref:Uncharacterized protein n=1 Tax=Orbilia blumenaviensis TaxID=1796055 RepID=A0AAV9VB49_9PEZI